MSKIISKLFLNQVVVSYEIVVPEGSHHIIARMREFLEQKGYRNHIMGINSKGEDAKVLLPYALLWKNGVTAAEAKNELRACATFLGVSLISLFATEINEWAAVSVKSNQVSYNKSINTE